MADATQQTSGVSTHEPYVPASASVPELTIRAIALGVTLSMVLAA